MTRCGKLLSGGCGLVLIVLGIASCSSHKQPTPAPAPVPAAAQRPGPNLPVSLIEAQLSAPTDDPLDVLRRGAISMLADTPAISEGKLPEGFPADALPPGATVRATAVAPGVTTVVVMVQRWTVLDRRKEHFRLTSAGWLNQGPTTTGFVSGPFASAVSVCRGADFIALRYIDRTSGGVFVRAQIRPDPRRACSPRPAVGGFGDLDTPVLFPPSGLQHIGGSFGGSPMSMNALTRMDTTQTPKALAAHYVSQLEADGWKVESVANDDSSISATRLGMNSRIGDRMTAVLAITAVRDSTFVDLALRIFRNTPQGPGYGQGPPTQPARPAPPSR